NRNKSKKDRGTMYEARVVDPHSLASMELNEYEAGKRSWNTSINNKFVKLKDDYVILPHNGNMVSISRATFADGSSMPCMRINSTLNVVNFA
ncbi:hypothetical protein K0M31_011348, partial [Melipona bicolor]